MRCQTKDCMNLTRTPTKVESYKKFGKCRKCCIEQGLIVATGREKGYHIRKPKGIAHAKGTGTKVKQPKLTPEEKSRKFWQTIHDNWINNCYYNVNPVRINSVRYS